MSSIDGIKIIKKNNYAICTVEIFSNELKQIIRTQLSQVCHGLSDSESSRVSYNYKSTLKEFITRYNTKTPELKIGMLGELLTHILFLNYFDKFDTVSPYFNLEERNIKKGFDLVLFNTDNNEIWITEVKSGQLHKDKNSTETTHDLLGTGKRDLKKRLNENNLTLWKNAITGVKTTLENYIDKKDVVKSILEDIQDTTTEEEATSSDKNIILVSLLFDKLDESIDAIRVSEFYLKLRKENIFNKEIIFSVHKETFKKIEDFLIVESL